MFPTADYKGSFGIVGISASAHQFQAGDLVFSIRNPGGVIALIRRIGFTLITQATASETGSLQLAWLLARNFSVEDSGGIVLAPAEKDSHGTSSVLQLRVASAGALTPGTRTLEANAFHGAIVPYKSGDRPYITDRLEINAERPLVLRPNEGLVLISRLATPATSLVAAGLEWEEVDVSYDSPEGNT